MKQYFKSPKVYILLAIGWLLFSIDSCVEMDSYGKTLAQVPEFKMEEAVGNLAFALLWVIIWLERKTSAENAALEKRIEALELRKQVN